MEQISQKYVREHVVKTAIHESIKAEIRKIYYSEERVKHSSKGI